MLPLLAGLAAGAAHVVTGPDHLAALGPIAVHDPARAVRTGAVWGLGHGVGVVAVGALGLIARSAIAIEEASAWSEFFVGFALVAVGIWALRRANLPLNPAPHEHPHGSTAFGFGLLHGAAGAGHVWGVIPSLALPLPAASAYLLAYLVGAVVAMAGVGAALGMVTRDRAPSTVRLALRTSAVLSIGVGGVWLWSGVPA